MLSQADVLLTVAPLSLEQIGQLKPGAVVVGFLQAHAQHAEVKALRDRKITSFAVELIPRISRAQSMDGLSSQASLAGYKAVLIAANNLEKFMPMLTTAAGHHPPVAGADHRRGRGGPAGHRHGAPPGRRGRGV